MSQIVFPKTITKVSSREYPNDLASLSMIFHTFLPMQPIQKLQSKIAQTHFKFVGTILPGVGLVMYGALQPTCVINPHGLLLKLPA